MPADRRLCPAGSATRWANSFRVTMLIIAAGADGDREGALQFARQAEQIEGIPGFAVRVRSYLMGHGADGSR